MPLKLSVGLARKVGQPDYGSLQSSCYVEFELDSGILQRDLEAFHQKVQNAYAACSTAVHNELARQQTPDEPVPKPEHHRNGNGQGGNGQGNRSTPRPATNSQVRALWAITNRQGVQLPQLLQNRFRVGKPEELSIADASTLIDALNKETNGAGARQ